MLVSLPKCPSTSVLKPLRDLSVHNQKPFIILPLPADICPALLFIHLPKRSKVQSLDQTRALCIFFHALLHSDIKEFSEQWIHHWTERLLHRGKQCSTRCSFLRWRPSKALVISDQMDRLEQGLFTISCEDIRVFKCCKQHYLRALHSLPSASHLKWETSHYGSLLSTWQQNRMCHSSLDPIVLTAILI